MNSRIASFCIALLMTSQLFAATEEKQPVVTIDENLWVVFYDVPSRRFGNIRSAFVKRDFETAASDLGISASYLKIEADRALPVIAERLNDVSNRMTWISDNIGDAGVTVTEFDSLFSRAHWLLAQHYLDMARRSRDKGQNRNAGLYLRATTHHLERAVLWSNSRISREVINTLEDLRDLADQLQDKELAKKAYRNKPMVKAEKLLIKLGKTIDRPVVLPVG